MYKYLKLLDRQHKGQILRVQENPHKEEMYDPGEKAWKVVSIWLEYVWVEGDYFGMYETLTKKEVDKLINAT